MRNRYPASRWAGRDEEEKDMLEMRIRGHALVACLALITAACGAVAPTLTVQARTSFTPAVK